ncbi:NIL domain-containing protein [Leptolyngbya sp. FACHB-261]|uniref:NIL domain-containing protein n=1 Tax=Leptolyngbya sp. FACHB-261 TaxID=2692806 RepID=UPI0016870DD4|nr:NIL domain-containing protein [Leptolyngbya sp. FACHB-261]MBD2100698.1 NIL domain-containing protein [Leptolyngbya sp. FACHB-261]
MAVQSSKVQAQAQTPESNHSDATDSIIQTRVRVRIPRNYYQDPVISQLASRHNLVVNITAALLGANARDEGWFDLELQGTAEQTAAGIDYLQSLNLDVYGLTLKDILESKLVKPKQPQADVNSTHLGNINPGYTNPDHTSPTDSATPATHSSATRSPVIDQALAHTRVRVRIPKTFREEPVISRLVSQYSLTVNIAGALLGPEARDDGWFDLELWGQPQQIQSGLSYLKQLKLQLWFDSGAADDW